MRSQQRLEHMVFMVISFLLSSTAAAHAAGAPNLTPEVTAPARALGAAYAAVAGKISPAVVSVSSEKMVKLRRQELPFPFGDDFLRHLFGTHPNPLGQQRESRVPEHGLGSGIIIDKQGHVLTNFHVVRDVDVIKVITADGRSFDAKVVGTDSKTRRGPHH
jgi:S1-C subfamily serine protease